MAAELAAGLRAVPGNNVFLSLSTGAEILASRDGPECALPVSTYDSLGGYLLRLLLSPAMVWTLIRRIRTLVPDIAICAMPGPLDLVMAWALRWLRVRFVVTVHDADPHPGDGFPLQMALQRRLIRRADGLIALTDHVATRLRQQAAASGKPLLTASLPPFSVGVRPPRPLSHGGTMRLLCFGRLLPYKGLDLLEAALREIGDVPCFEVRVVGQGPQDETLRALSTLAHVQVENRWVPEDEVGALIAWSDAVVLPYREASQSGVAAIAIAAGRWVVATRVGGLAEQFSGERLALLCDPDPASIRAALTRLLTAPPPLSTEDADPRSRWREMAERLSRQISEAFTAPGAMPGREAASGSSRMEKGPGLRAVDQRRRSIPLKAKP